MSICLCNLSADVVLERASQNKLELLDILSGRKHAAPLSYGALRKAMSGRSGRIRKRA